MANVNQPRGFKPVRLFDGSPYNGAINPYRLPSGYATTLFVGDAVKLLTTGYLAKAAAGDQIRGIVAGFAWANGSNPPSRYWPGGGVTSNASDVEVQVIDDPRVLFEAAFTNSASVPVIADIGANYNLFDVGGNTSTGVSGEGVDYSTLTTSAAQFRLYDFVKRPDNDLTTAYPRGLFVPALHDYRVTTGI